MAASPRWKVYNEHGEYVASVKDPVYAACLVDTFGGTIRDGHSTIVWREGQEEQLAGESYDHVAETVYNRSYAQEVKRAV